MIKYNLYRPILTSNLIADCSIRPFLFLAIFFTFSITAPIFSQNAIFSQYYASSLYLNPALAGLQPDISLNTNYRMQWQSINPYTTGQVSLIYPFLNKNNPLHEHRGGAGLSVYQDNAGASNAVKTTVGTISLAYNLNLSTEKTSIVSFGLQGGLVQLQLNTNNFAWGSQYTIGSNQIDIDAANDPRPQRTYPTIAGGAVWYFENSKDNTTNNFKAFGGFSGYQLNRANRALLNSQSSRAPILLKFHGGVSIPLSNKISLSPNALVAFQDNLHQINTGMYLSFLITDNDQGIFAHPELIVGGWYRWGDAAIFNAGFATRKFTLGFSYDHNSSSLSNFSNNVGAYEISLAIKISRGVQLKHYATPRI